MGVSLKLQKRLASSVLSCGVRKARSTAGCVRSSHPHALQVWMDPNECNEISMANSRACTGSYRAGGEGGEGGGGLHSSPAAGWAGRLPPLPPRGR